MSRLLNSSLNNNSLVTKNQDASTRVHIKRCCLLLPAVNGEIHLTSGSPKSSGIKGKLPWECGDIVLRFQNVVLGTTESHYSAPPQLLRAVNLSRPAIHSTVSITFHDLYTFTLGVLLVWGCMLLPVCVWVWVCMCTYSLHLFLCGFFFLWSNCVHIFSHRVKVGLNAPNVAVFWQYVALTRTKGQSQCYTQVQLWVKCPPPQLIWII